MALSRTELIKERIPSIEERIHESFEFENPRQSPNAAGRSRGLSPFERSIYLY